jgi:hypothetical protein
MDQILKELLEQSTSNIQEVRERALLQVCMFLEKHTTLANKPNFYREILPPGVFSLILTEQELFEFIGGLGDLVLSAKITPNIMLCAVGETTRQAVLAPMLFLLCNRGYEMSEEAKGDTLQAIDRCTVLEDGKLRSEITQLFNENNPLRVLQSIIDTESPRLKKLAREILNKLQEGYREK